MLLCLLAQVHAAAQPMTLKMPDQEVKRNRRGSDEREAVDKWKVEVNALFTPDGIYKLFYYPQLSFISDLRWQ